MTDVSRRQYLSALGASMPLWLSGCSTGTSDYEQFDSDSDFERYTVNEFINNQDEIGPGDHVEITGVLDSANDENIKIEGIDERKDVIEYRVTDPNNNAYTEVFVQARNSDNFERIDHFLSNEDVVELRGVVQDTSEVVGRASDINDRLEVYEVNQVNS
jgi:hypothetical protein